MNYDLLSLEELKQHLNELKTEQEKAYSDFIYQSIQSSIEKIEEIIKTKEIAIKDYDRAIETIKHVCPLANIEGTDYELAIKSLEKEIPRDVINKDTNYLQYCPACGDVLLRENDKYCSNCGQKLMWD